MRTLIDIQNDIANCEKELSKVQHYNNTHKNKRDLGEMYSLYWKIQRLKTKLNQRIQRDRLGEKSTSNPE